ncbi:MAG: response regulator transcription factor [Tepidiformaceae bacterium]
MDTTPGIQQLSDRERDILALIAKGRTNVEIGDALGLRFDTVKWYVSEILSKLAVDSREQAAQAWRAHRRPQAVLSRRLRVLIGLPLAKVGMGLAATAAAGGLVVAAGAGFEGGDAPGAVQVSVTPQPTFEVVVTPNPAFRPPTPSDPRQYEPGDANPIGPRVDIVSTTFDGTTYTLGMYKARLGLCQYWWDSNAGPPAESGMTMCLVVDEPRVLSMMGVGPGRPSAGIGVAEMVRVRLRLHGGEYVEQDTVAAPAELGVPWRFWIYAGERSVVGVEGLDAAGNVVEWWHTP